MAWKPVRHVQPGEAVSAGTVGRPDGQLQARTEELKRRLDAADSGRVLVDAFAPLDSQVQVGQAVYWNVDTARYEQALAGVETDATSGSLVQTAASQCLGIVVRKASSLVGDVAISGLVTLETMEQAIAEESPAGWYYLSPTDPGKLVSQKPPVSVPVCFVFGPQDPCDPQVRVLVHAQQHDFLENHIHYRFSLVCRPAGDTTPPDVDQRHTITNPDTSLEGWLPADHGVFNGLAPTGAVFGYNLGAHAALGRVWPPIPIQAVAVLWDKGAGLVGATEVPLGRDGLVICDIHGIWWMSDCAGDVPWPTTLDTATESSLSLSISETPECDRRETMRLDVLFSRQVFGTDRSVVTSLQSAEGSPIVITNCDGETANTGDLYVAIDPEQSMTDDAPDGSLVIKNIGDDSFQYRRGRVLEGVIAGSDNTVITSTHSRRLVDGDESSALVHQGIATISVLTTPTERDLPPELVRLDNAKQVLVRELQCYELPAGKNSGLRVKLRIPNAGLPTNPQIQIVTLLFGPTGGTMADLDATYRRVARPDPTTTISADPDDPLTYDSTVEISAYSLIEVRSEPVTVAAGDTVFVTLSRTGNAGYAGNVEVLHLGAVLLSGG